MRRSLTAFILATVASASVLSAQTPTPRLGPRLDLAGVSPNVTVETRSFINTAAPGSTLPNDAAVRVAPAPDSAATHPSNRGLHMVIGGAIGAVVGWMAGRSVDTGRAGCDKNSTPNNAGCDWTSGYEEPAGALLGMLLGVGIGALWPHD